MERLESSPRQQCWEAWPVSSPSTGYSPMDLSQGPKASAQDLGLPLPQHEEGSRKIP